MQYILRAVIHEKSWERQLEDIIELCQYAGIEEVFVKEQCHQVLMSPVPLAKHKRMANIYQEMSVALAEHGIRFSINLATIIGHCDAKLKPEMILPFTKFVGETLEPSHSNYCILDPDWLTYAKEVVTFYAAANPYTFMIDDDFRSVNHTSYLGCFCELHVKQTAEKCGMPLTAESVKNHVLGNSPEDRVVRQAWREINFSGQLQAAKAIEQAIHAVNPDIHVGLMNSGEPNHSVQGRDIELLLKTFAGPYHLPVTRPLGGPYEDCLHEALITSHHGMALSLAQIEEAEVISEVENWPHTRYTKGIYQTQLQMKLHALAGADKVSMNIYDFMASPYGQEPKWGEMIKNTKADLEKIEQARRGKKLCGLGMLWHKDCAQTQENLTHTGQGIVPNREADALFSMLGLPVAFTPQAANFLTGSVAANFTDPQIKELLAGGLLLDSTAFELLVKRGFAPDLGCTFDGYISEVSSERLTDPAFCGPFTENQIPTDWMRLGLQEQNIPKLQAFPGARIVSEILDVEEETIGQGICLFQNRLGGRVAVLPVPLSAWTMAYRSKAFLLRNLVRYLQQDSFDFYLAQAVNVAPIYYANPEEGLLALLNTGLDPENVKIETAYPLYEAGQKISCNLELKPLELRFLTLDKRTIRQEETK